MATGTVSAKQNNKRIKNLMDARGLSRAVKGGQVQSPDKSTLKEKQVTYFEEFKRLCEKNGVVLDTPEQVKEKYLKAVKTRERNIEKYFPKRKKAN